MSNVLGIVAEYNPLHNGHVYHINESKKRVNADLAVAVISGNFTQRGEPSIVDKWEKTKMALQSGIDLVIELPTLYSISSAENFANGAVKILNELGIVNLISFGAETDNLDVLEKIADIFLEEPIEYKNLLKQELAKGLSFPTARQYAMDAFLNSNDDILSGSNNILAIEYLKALKNLKSEIKPLLIKREKTDYNENAVVDNFASSTAVRKLLAENKFDEVKKVVPNTTLEILKNNIENGTFVNSLEIFSNVIIYKLRTMTVSEIAELPDVSEGLENLIKQSADETNDIVELVNLIKSKRYIQTRVQRILLYALLEIKKSDMDLSKSMIPYIRILGFSKNGEQLLSKISENKNVITSLKKFEINSNYVYKRMLEIDKLSTDIFTLGFKKNSFSNLDYTNNLIII